MRRTTTLLVALSLLVIAHLWIPRPAAACSCVAPIDSLEMVAQDPGASIFTATTGPTIADQMQVLVTRWFAGQPISGIAAVEILLGDSAMCGMSPLPAGREYLFQTYPSESARYSLSGCSPQGDLATPDGQALLARAIELYGPPAVEPTESPAPVAPTVAPTEDPTPVAPTETPTQLPAPVAPTVAPTDAPPVPAESFADPTPAGLVGSLVGAAVPVALIVAFALGLVAGLALILRRRGGDGA
jgi:hypothetical protein